MRILATIGALAIALAVPASAAGIDAYKAATFATLQSQNRPVVIFVHAPWCPICRAQEQTIKQLLATPKYKGVTVLTIDFDSQKPLWTKFGASKQSTLIGFHGSRETSRLSYDADPAKVTALLASTLR
jgi:thiol-disulfide isomerase/thioredoxin